jgi:hypothetical protein
LVALFIMISLVSACREESADGLPLPLKRTRVLEFNEKILLKAIVDILKEKGFENPKVDTNGGKVETEYFVHEDFRTKVEATVKKISRKEGEVTLSVITEVKSSAGWKERQILDKGQYDKFFDEIEMQAYRELAKAE